MSTVKQFRVYLRHYISMQASQRCVSKNHLWLATSSTYFSTYVIQTVSNQTVIYFPMSPNQCLCATWQNMGTRKLQLLTQMYCCFAEVQLVAALFLQYS